MSSEPPNMTSEPPLPSPFKWKEVGKETADAVRAIQRGEEPTSTSTLHVYSATDFDKKCADYRAMIAHVTEITGSNIPTIDQMYDAIQAANPKCQNCWDNHRRESTSKLFHCSACRGVKYCDVVCQREHWKQHKRLCNR
jgi:hypothetical protein